TFALTKVAGTPAQPLPFWAYVSAAASAAASVAVISDRRVCHPLPGAGGNAGLLLSSTSTNAIPAPTRPRSLRPPARSRALPRARGPGGGRSFATELSLAGEGLRHRAPERDVEIRHRRDADSDGLAGAVLARPDRRGVHRNRRCAAQRHAVERVGDACADLAL